MATAATVPRAPIPRNYFCKSCGLEAHHWIMDCSLLAIFNAANTVLHSVSVSNERKDEDLPDSLLQITCKENHSVTECQSMYRIIMALIFYQQHTYDNEALLQYFTHRYPHLLNDYTHILSAHLDGEKQINDINAALIYTKITQYIQCDITKCPHFVRHHDESNSSGDLDTDEIIFLNNTLDTIHCYFLHPFHTGFKMINCDNDNDKKHDDDNMVISWDDEELTCLQSELNVRRHLLRSIRGNEYNTYNKFMMNIPCKDVEKNKHFGQRYYYWNWYKNNEKDDWRCNEGRTYCELYIAQKYSNLKEEMTANIIFRLNIASFNAVYIKALNYLNSSQIIRKMKCSGNQSLHYDVDDDSSLQIHHLIALILHSDYRKLQHFFVSTFRKRERETEEGFKVRKSEYHLWSKYLRETVELYGTPLNESKINIFYVTISRSIVFSSFVARFCVPTSTTTQLQIVSMCTQNGAILELTSTNEITSFYCGLLKYFNCSLISRFGEENERLFIGGWAPLQLNNIRILIQRKENYRVFIRAIQHFNAVLNGEESDEFDIDDHFNGMRSRCNTSYLSRAYTQSYETSCSQYVEDQYATTETHNIGNYNSFREEYNYNNLMECTAMDGVIMDALCCAADSNGYPEYINMMFRQMMHEKDGVFINLYDLRTNYKPFCAVLLSGKCEELIRFHVVNALCPNCRFITVDMNKYEQLDTKYLLALCQEMVQCAKQIKRIKGNKLHKIVLLRVKRECITLDIWSKFHKKYHRKYSEELWFKCLSRFRYNFAKDLELFFDDEAYDEYLKTHKETDIDQMQNDDEKWPIDATQSYRL